MNGRTRSGARHGAATGTTAPALLGIYLNDHLAGATAGTERSAHMLRAHRGSRLAAELEPVAAEIAEDRASLLEIMDDLGVPVRRYKVYTGRLAERMGRLKGNGRLVRPSPLTPLVELEALWLGVEGKAAVWQALREIAEDDPRLDARRLDELGARARGQQRVLEELRRRQAATVLRTPQPA